MGTKDTIAAAAEAVLAEIGIGRLTVGLVARRARVSTALVHYHYRTKAGLVGAVAERLAASRTERRLGALEGGSGVATLDALWAAVAIGAGAGGERACLDLALAARDERAAGGARGGVRAALSRAREREIAGMMERLPRLLAALGARPRIPADDLAAAVCTFVDGVGAALASGAGAEEIRVSFDAFWLALVGPGQGPSAG
jgi:AcrR family transcriptional regulator